jgi:predicted TPR repeat methyltransferase
MLGNVREEQGRDLDALACFERCGSLDPRHARSINNLGATQERLGRRHAAGSAYLRANQVDPKLVEPYLNLGRLFESDGDLTQAARYFREGLIRHPGHPMLGHLLAAATGDCTASAPREHVEAYFDGFAPYFDAHMQALDYGVPAALAGLLDRANTAQRILDLGCGTGLMGAALASPQVKLVGVDLSKAMVERARMRGIYSALAAGDACEVLATFPPSSFDVVVAADFLIYLGELHPLFAGVSRVLETSGRFGFSVEALDLGTYRLQSSGRYAHSEAYIEALATSHRMRPVSKSRLSLRREGTGAAAGVLVVLERL